MFHFKCAVSVRGKHKKSGSLSSVFWALYGMSCVILFSDYRGYVDYNHARVGARWELISHLNPRGLLEIAQRLNETFCLVPNIRFSNTFHSLKRNHKPYWDNFLMQPMLQLPQMWQLCDYKSHQVAFLSSLKSLVATGSPAFLFQFFGSYMRKKNVAWLEWKQKPKHNKTASHMFSLSHSDLRSTETQGGTPLLGSECINSRAWSWRWIT